MDFVIFSSIVWDDQGGAHRPTQLALALVRQSHRVLFIEPGSCPPRVVGPNIRVLSLGALGPSEAELARAWFGFDEPMRGDLLQNLNAELTQFERDWPRVAIWDSSFIPFVRLLPELAARGYQLVYDCLDDFADAETRGHYFANPQAENYLAQNVDLIITVTSALVEKFRALQNRVPVECLPNGLNPEFGAREPVPPDLSRGQVTLGFWGPLQDFTVDTDALCYIARTRPNWALNLIGAYDLPRSPRSELEALRALPNVHLLGPRPHEVLGHYLTGFDVCLIPFPDNAFSRGRDPIKLYEYLAGYKPVVALNTPQLSGVPYVFLAGSDEEFLAQIDAAARQRVDKRAVDEFLRANSWPARADKLCALLAALPAREPITISALPEHFDDPATFAARTQAYVAHLEWTVDERLAYIRTLEQHAHDVEAYLEKLERTHPLVWLKRVLKKG